MSKRKSPAPRASPKDIAAGIAARKTRDESPALDHARLARSSQQAAKAADHLLRELDDVLRNLDRKR